MFSLYKYFQATDLQIDTLSNKQLFFAHPSLLNDSFDTSDKLINEFPTFCNNIRWNDELSKKLDCHGICSMSKGYRPDNRHLWSLYSGNYSGFAVEYDTETLCEYITDNGMDMREVQYRSRPLNLNNMLASYEVPEHEDNYVYHIFECFQGDICDKAINRLFEFLHLQKEEKIWSIEEEMRIIINEHKPRIASTESGKGYIIPLEKECFKNLYIGYRTSQDAKKRLKQIAHNLECSIFIVEPKVVKGNWDVEITKV